MAPIAYAVARDNLQPDAHFSQISVSTLNLLIALLLIIGVALALFVRRRRRFRGERLRAQNERTVWHQTWTQSDVDFTAVQDGFKIGRVYLSATGQVPFWRWFVHIDNGVDVPGYRQGTEQTRSKAVEAVEVEWNAAKAWSSSTGIPLNVHGRLRPPT